MYRGSAIYTTCLLDLERQSSMSLHMFTLFYMNSLLPTYASATWCATYKYNCKECFIHNYFMFIPPDDDPRGIEKEFLICNVLM